MARMTKSLRDRQRQVARETILNAVADHLAEHGSFEFSIAEIAERAGVSQRTVYNYFGSRSDLIDAFSDWTDQTIHESGGTALPRDLDQLPEAVISNFGVFEENSGVAEALARLDSVERLTSAHARRTEAFSEVVRDAFPDMSEREVTGVALLMRQLGSVRTWYSLTREHGLSTDDAASVTAWALQQLKSSLDRGDLPELADEGERGLL
jgi:AcrR family transcriptional regulator